MVFFKNCEMRTFLCFSGPCFSLQKEYFSVLYIFRTKIYKSSFDTGKKVLINNDTAVSWLFFQFGRKFLSKNHGNGSKLIFTPQFSFHLYAPMPDFINDVQVQDLYDPSLNGMYEPVPLRPVLRRSWRRILNAASPKGRCWSQSAA